MSTVLGNIIEAPYLQVFRTPAELALVFTALDTGGWDRGLPEVTSINIPMNICVQKKLIGKVYTDLLLQKRYMLLKNIASCKIKQCRNGTKI